MSSGRRPARMPAPRRPAGKAVGVALALAATAMPTAAVDRPVALPLHAPAGADPLTTDFVEICSAGVADVAKGGALALARGWASMNEGLAAGALAALGAFSAAKTFDAGSATLSINRAAYPHLAVINCQFVVADADMAAVDPAAVAKIDGVRGGGGLIAASMPKAGFWSLADEEGEVVTISSIPVGTSLVLNMSRGVRLDPDTGQPSKRSQTAR